jgi:nucleotide-binding universal stress UspA family protein
MEPSFSRILVPVDFSPSSKLALEYALSLADRSGGKVDVLHAWEVPAYLRPDLTVWAGEVSATLAEHTRSEAERSMKEFLQRSGASGKANVTSRVLMGPAYNVIVSAADEGGFNLIAMGTHGRTGISHLVLGSVAEKVVRHAKCPVLTVRAPRQ